MRILVISDSHGRTNRIEEAISAHSEAKHVFFLGDCERDVEDLPFIYPDRIFHVISGNCDYSSMLKSSDSTTVNGVKIFFTHGHTFSVKSGSTHLFTKARTEGYDLVLYGHTHVASCEYNDGIHVVNPGSIGQPRDASAPSYALIDLEPSGIMPIIVRM